jgi:hypothetical protein
MFGNDFTVSYNELADELKRTNSGSVTTRLNAALRVDGKQYASSAADIVLTMNPNCAADIPADDVPAPSPAPAKQVPGTTPQNGAIIDGSKVKDPAAPKEANPVGPYGTSYTQFTISGGAGLLNMEGKDNAGRDMAPISSDTKQFKLQLSNFTPNTRSFINYTRTTGSDNAPTGLYKTIISNMIRADTIAAGGDVRILGKGNIGIGIGGQIQYTGTSTSVGGIDQNSRRSDIYFTGGPELVFGRFNKSYALLRAEATGQSGLGKYDTAFGPYRAASSLEFNPAAYAAGRLFLTNKLYVDAEGRYGITKSVFTTSGADKITDKARNWNASVGFNYDLYRKNNNAFGMGITLKHAGSQSTFPYGPTYMNGNSAQFNLNFTFGKK